MAGQLIKLQPILHRCKAILYESEALAQSKALPVEMMLIQIQQTFLIVRSLCEAIEYDPMELLNVLPEHHRPLELDDIVLPTAFRDALIAKIEESASDATQRSLRSYIFWGERLVRYVIRAARTQADYSLGLTVPDRRRGPRAVAPIPTPLNLPSPGPTAAMALSPTSRPTLNEPTTVHPTVSNSPRPVDPVPVQGHTTAAVGRGPLMPLTNPDLLSASYPTPPGHVDDPAGILPTAADGAACEEVEPRSTPVRSEASFIEVNKNKPPSGELSSSAPPETGGVKQQSEAGPPEVETTAALVLPRSEDIRIVREARIFYIRPQDGAAGIELERAVHRVWSDIAAAALGAFDGSAAAQILTPAERGYRGVAPTPTLSRHLLTVARASMAAAGEAAEITRVPQEECLPRSAAHLSRLDVASAFAQPFEVAPECLEDLILRGVIDDSALEQYVSDLMNKFKPKWKSGNLDLSSISPPLGAYMVNKKPIYIASAHAIRNAKTKQCLRISQRDVKFPSDIVHNIANGRHVLVFNPAGSGKTLLLDRIHPNPLFSLVYFNAAQGLAQIRGDGGDFTNTWDNILAELSNRKTREFALVIDECTFLTPAHLSQLHIFRQIVMVGDPCQLGAPLAAEFIHDFMSRIGAFCKLDGVVYRTRNPEVFRLLNYIGYDGRFAAAESDPELESSTFQIVNCNQHRLSKAVSIVLATLSYAKLKKSILIASQDFNLLNLVNSLILNDIDISQSCAELFKLTQLSNLQGKQADVLIFDPSEVDRFISDPYTATRYLTMILGRATSTFCLITPDREIVSCAEDVRPFSLMFFGCCQYRPPGIDSI